MQHLQLSKKKVLKLARNPTTVKKGSQHQHRDTHEGSKNRLTFGTDADVYVRVLLQPGKASIESNGVSTHSAEKSATCLDLLHQWSGVCFPTDGSPKRSGSAIEEGKKCDTGGKVNAISWPSRSWPLMCVQLSVMHTREREKKTKQRRPRSPLAIEDTQAIHQEKSFSRTKKERTSGRATPRVSAAVGSL